MANLPPLFDEHLDFSQGERFLSAERQLVTDWLTQFFKGAKFFHHIMYVTRKVKNQEEFILTFEESMNGEVTLSIHTGIAQTATNSCIDSLHLFTGAVKDNTGDGNFWAAEFGRKSTLLESNEFTVQAHNSAVVSNPSIQGKIVMRFIVGWRVHH